MVSDVTDIAPDVMDITHATTGCYISEHFKGGLIDFQRGIGYTFAKSMGKEWSYEFRGENI